MSEKIETILRGLKQGNLSIKTIASKANCSQAYVGKIIKDFGLSKPNVPRANAVNDTAKKQKMDMAIKEARSHLQSKSVTEVLNESPKLRNAVICILYESNSLAMIREHLLTADIDLSRERIRAIIGDRIVQRDTVNRKQRGLSPEVQSHEAQIIEMFDGGMTINAIASELDHVAPTVRKILAEAGRDTKQRLRSHSQTYQTGDRVHNWEIVSKHDRGSYLCRDVRNGAESVVSIQALRLGKSKGCRELAPPRRKPSPKAIAAIPQILELYQNGVNLSAIARTVGMSRTYCERIAKRG